jgi:hypothetical protein
MKYNLIAISYPQWIIRKNNTYWSNSFFTRGPSDGVKCPKKIRIYNHKADTLISHINNIYSRIIYLRNISLVT